MTVPATPRTALPRRRRPVRALAAVLAPAAALLAGLALLAGPAHANPPGPHDPIGGIDRFTVLSSGAVHVSGWAADPDALGTNVTVYGLADGLVVDSPRTFVHRPWLAHQHHTGSTPGFDLTIPLPSTGVHTACLAVQNIGAGMSRILGCTTTPAGTQLSAAQLAAHSPHGVVSAVTTGPDSLRVHGWVYEPDYVGGPSTLVLYVDGSPARTMGSYTASRAQVAAGSGRRGNFTAGVAVSPGAHTACVWAVNGGYGSNQLLGCAAVDTRGAAGTGPVSQPAVNTAVVTEAKRHIGQPYVWGATGPKSFDCSGLVMYSYAKAGVTTPRIAQDQFHAARVIPASRAVPGDLVFYHDSEGAVYHVGIYLAPGNSVAAIDQQEGVNYQDITWNAAWASYGSLTHD